MHDLEKGGSVSERVSKVQEFMIEKKKRENGKWVWRKIWPYTLNKK